MAYIHGSDGSCTFGNDNHIAFNTWSATVTRTVHDITSFGDTGRRRMLGLVDVTGSAGGFPVRDAGANTSPGAGAGIQAESSTGGAIVLTFDADPDGGSASTALTWGFTGIIDSIAASVTMGGESTMTFNFQLSNGGALTETWDETA